MYFIKPTNFRESWRDRALYGESDTGRVALRKEGCDRDVLSWEEMREVLACTILRRHRNRGWVERALERLRRFGSCDYDYATKLEVDGFKLRFYLSVTAIPGGYKVNCTGDLAEWNLERVNRGAGFTPSGQGTFKCGGRRQVCGRLRRLNHARIERRKKLREERQKRNEEAAQERARRRAQEQQRKPQPAAFTLSHNETDASVVRQFRKHRVLLEEAARAVEKVFRIGRHWKYDGVQMAEMELLASLKRNGGAFMQVKRHDKAHGIFALRFDVHEEVDVEQNVIVWTFTVAFTKDNRDPRYRRAREFFGKILFRCIDGKARRVALKQGDFLRCEIVKIAA